MSGQHSTAKTIFLDCLEIASADARFAYLNEKCGDDQSLRREVEELLRHHDKIGPLSEPAPTATMAAIEQPGTVIGPYKLMEQIGEGGMGLVFVAEQHQPVRRKVALKVIKPGMDTRDVIARFEAERQALPLG
jgi:eukaryotic-like serine/threonine-protein kinase